VFWPVWTMLPGTILVYPVPRRCCYNSLRTCALGRLGVPDSCTGMAALPAREGAGEATYA